MASRKAKDPTEDDDFSKRSEKLDMQQLFTSNPSPKAGPVSVLEKKENIPSNFKMEMKNSSASGPGP